LIEQALADQVVPAPVLGDSAYGNPTRYLFTKNSHSGNLSRFRRLSWNGFAAGTLAWILSVSPACSSVRLPRMLLIRLSAKTTFFHSVAPPFDRGTTCSIEHSSDFSDRSV
jgi:hypothetical protein